MEASGLGGPPKPLVTREPFMLFLVGGVSAGQEAKPQPPRLTPPQVVLQETPLGPKALPAGSSRTPSALGSGTLASQRTPPGTPDFGGAWRLPLSPGSASREGPAHQGPPRTLPVHQEPQPPLCRGCSVNIAEGPGGRRILHPRCARFVPQGAPGLREAGPGLSSRGQWGLQGQAGATPGAFCKRGAPVASKPCSVAGA